MRTKQLLIAMIGVFFLLPLLGAAAYVARQSLDLLNSTDRAVGTITGFNYKSEPVITFDYHGKRYQITQPKVSDLMTFEMGSREEILVEPLEPELSTLNRFGNLWGGVAVLLVFSALIAGMAALVWFVL